MRDEPHDAEQRDERDDALRDDAVEAPHLEHAVFDAGEMQREGATDDGKDGKQNPPAKERKDAQDQVACHADGGNRNVGVGQFTVGAVVDDTAIPVVVNGAGLGCG